MLLVFGVGLQVYGPIGSVEVGDFQGGRVRPGIDGALDGLGIPFHVNQDGCFLAGRGMPLAMPGTGERMSFLRPDVARQSEKTQQKNRSSAHQSSIPRTVAILYGGAAETQETRIMGNSGPTIRRRSRVSQNRHTQ